MKLLSFSQSFIFLQREFNNIARVRVGWDKGNKKAKAEKSERKSPPKPPEFRPELNSIILRIFVRIILKKSSDFVH